MQKLTLTVIISQACMIFYVSQSLSPAVSKYNYEVSFVRRHLPRNLVTLRSRGEALRKAFFAKGKNTTCDEASEEIRCTASTRPFWNNVVHDPYNKDFFANQQLFMLYSEAQRNTQKAKFWKYSRPFTNPPLPREFYNNHILQFRNHFNFTAIVDNRFANFYLGLLCRILSSKRNHG